MDASALKRRYRYLTRKLREEKGQKINKTFGAQPVPEQKTAAVQRAALQSGAGFRNMLFAYCWFD